jgi:hypothetical protein
MNPPMTRTWTGLMPGGALHSQHCNGMARRRRGFALVITLSLMILLTVVAVGLLGLSIISLRSSSQDQAISAARSNARLGLMLALGELQSSLGPDQRVSASSSAVIASAKQPHLTGAWDSWRWDPTQSSAPDYAEKRAKFRLWLVSTATPGEAKNFELPAANPLESAVELIGTLSNQNVLNSVRAGEIPVMQSAQPGSLAWAVFDESTKASIDLGDPAKKPTAGEEIAARGAPPRFRADTLDSTKLASLKTPVNLITLETAVIPAGQANAPDVRKRFHDFTTGSLGLLTDTANGGLKTDLTSLLEAATFPTNSFSAATLYSTTAAAAPCWNYLYDHYRKYLTVTSANLGTPTYAPPAAELAVSPTGMDSSPQMERLLPVIAKMQLVFSLVSHNSSGPRATFLNNFGDPKGNDNFAVPHIVYEPVITLFNPYDVALDLKKIRIRVWDPPVGFRFAKGVGGDGVDHWFRAEMATGEFHGLARFQWNHEKDPTARRWFTLCLTDGTSQAAGKALRLQAGEVKVFSSRVQSNWSWSLECTDPAASAFFDWKASSDFGDSGNFGNIDNRTNNRMGVEAVPGWDPRAGLQTDSVSYGIGNRPTDLLYDFETKNGALYQSFDGFVSIKTTDEVKVELKALRTTATNSAVPDFQVDVLAGNTEDASQDLLRRYRFNFANPTAEISQDPDKPVIVRKYKVADILQPWTDTSKGGKKCLAMLEMTARTTHDPLDDSKAWVYNNPVVEGGDQTTSVVGAANQSYDLRLMELSGWTSFPIIEWDATVGAGYGRGYFGASRSSAEGVTNVPMCRVPVAPAASLGDLIPSNLVSGSLLPRVVHPFGNSRAHPLLPPDKVTRALGITTALDHSYLLNDALWDRYYFSSVAAYAGGVFATNRSRRDVLEGVLDGSKPALNTRLRPASNTVDAARLAGKLDDLSDPARATQLAAHLAVGGPFNLNSTSIDAWRAVLAALRDREVTAWKNRATPNPDATPCVRMGLPLACPKDTSDNVNVLGQIRWAGYRSLSDAQIESLAKAIVTQIQQRGIEDKAPPLTLAEFINRRPGSAGSLHSLAGILQTAIDNSGVNTANHALDSKSIKITDIPAARMTGALTPEDMNGLTGEGAPSILTQGDLLGALASIATVRGDTFKIRAYGEATSSTGKVQARAWCEAEVQRVPDFVDPADAPETPVASLTCQPNKSFGRRFHIVSFRWLTPWEIR